MSTPPRPVAGRLVELAVTDLGIIDHLSLVLGPGMTALTGETGAGKTMVVGAIDLLLGGRAEASMVRAGAGEAVVEGRFEVDGRELILTRVVPAEGRSRAYVNGRMATAAALADEAVTLVDLHGQQAHQSLLVTRTQRAALDGFADIDLTPLAEARQARRVIGEELASLGGDAGARAREADLLRFQADELVAAQLLDQDEDAQLDQLEDLLAGAVSHRESAAGAVAALTDEGGAGDGLGLAIAGLDAHAPFDALVERLRSVQAELSDVAAEVRSIGEGIDDDPARLAEIRERRQLLVDLRRKYGTASLADDGSGTGAGTLRDVIAYRDAVIERLGRLEDHDARAADLERQLAEAEAREATAAAVVGQARRSAAPALGAAVEAHLRDLAMPSARVEVSVGAEDPGDDVTFLLAANPGVEPAPLSRIASGGELARSMLALRLVLGAAPPVLVFDEVDAGIGGQAALAVGRSLAAMGTDHQVLVVTHLPQVAAFADHQVRVHKEVRNGTTVSSAVQLAGPDRVVELSRMLSGTPDSQRVQGAADELLALAASERGRR
ncbi:MAG: recN [Acidimicrobiales bacterium]|nr:recN [Acidimicrobiales bacterium]